MWCCQRRDEGPNGGGNAPVPPSLGGGGGGGSNSNSSMNGGRHHNGGAQAGVAATLAGSGKSAAPGIFQQPSHGDVVSQDELLKRENLLVAQLFLRGTMYNLAERDYYYLNRRIASEKCSFMLQDPYGPPKLMTMMSATPAYAPGLGTSSGKLRVQRTLLGLRFPFVMQLSCAEYLSEKKKLVVVRGVSDDATMRQVVYGQKFHADDEGRIGSPLSLSHVAQYGRQILEAVCFLRHKGISCAHLHLGNIFVDPDIVTCRISDYENGLVGIPVQLSTFVQAAMRRIRDVSPGAEVQEDVLCFYHVIHEMTLGYAPGGSPNSADPLRVPQTAPRSIQKILKDILKGKLPTVVHVLEMELFAEAPLPDHITSFTSYATRLQTSTVPTVAVSKGGGEEDDEVSA